MMSPLRRAEAGRVRGLAGLVAGLGAALVLRPEATSRALSGGAPVPDDWIVRVLGARLLAQGMAEIVRPRRLVVLAGAAADALHGLSMLAAAAYFPRYRRVALVSGALAGTSMVAVPAASTSGFTREEHTP